MGVEIERKFLVKPNTDWKDNNTGKFYRQGYICKNNGLTLRIRIKGDMGVLTLKGAVEGLTRDEYEYTVPLQDANELLAKYCNNNIVEKYRYCINYAGKNWEVDEFIGKNKGLVLAELELQSENENFEKPLWIDKEVTGDIRYYNSYLAQNPFLEWK